MDTFAEHGAHASKSVVAPASAVAFCLVPGGHVLQAVKPGTSPYVKRGQGRHSTVPFPNAVPFTALAFIPLRSAATLMPAPHTCGAGLYVPTGHSCVVLTHGPGAHALKGKANNMSVLCTVRQDNVQIASTTHAPGVQHPARLRCIICVHMLMCRWRSGHNACSRSNTHLYWFKLSKMS